MKDWIQLITSIITAITSIVAIIISIRSLNTTKRSIESANRPSVAAYLNWEWLDSNLREYLVVKNFGKSGAIITSIVFSETWKNSQNQQPIFNDMNGYFIAPSQKFISLAEVNANGTGPERARKVPITMTINYTWDKGNKSDSFTHTFSADAYKNFEVSRRDSGFNGSPINIETLIYRIAHEFFRTHM
ncbi:hypothetical protein [Levilactobacillus andaensis]|uniref:hypothetical protein n=1 Tax=Levilactobacillus andaensis TaxID=2799570 RepID=UPI001940EA09|nr:hypothetical protein [Levilactobacillus andaensis]